MKTIKVLSYLIRAYIKPLSSNRKLHWFLGIFIVLIYILLKTTNIISYSVSTTDSFWYIFDIILDVANDLGVVLKVLLQNSYYIPLFGSLAYEFYLFQYWLRFFYRENSFSLTKILYKIFFFANFIPNIIGYASSMIAVVWLVLVYFHVLLHKPKPRNSKDSTFLKVLSFKY